MAGLSAAARVGAVGVLALGAAALLAGFGRRSALLALGAFPVMVGAAAVLGAVGQPTRSLPTAALLFGGASLCAYLLSAARHLATVAAPALPPASRPRKEVPARWRRRLRVYRGLAAASVLIPAVLIAEAELHSTIGQKLTASFGEAAVRARSLILIGVGILWAFLFRGRLVDVLKGHLEHDRAFLAAKDEALQQARSGRPRAGFYVAVVVALCAMLGLILERGAQ
jgi:hypothetical protein